MVFDGAGQSAGLSIWRIEDFAPVEYDSSLYGKFHIGDSYIVLNTKESKSGSFTWDVHFWLGDETSQDESGSAAVLTVELDDILGGAPIQHREIQGSESDLFLSYFKKGVRYLPGGIKSGFTHYDPEDVVRRLFKVKGKRNIQVSEVPIAASSLNKSDCFILDNGKNHDILVLMPAGAKRMEKFKAIQVANEIRDEDHGGGEEVIICDEHSGDIDKFFESLGEGSMDDLPEDDGEDDAAADLLSKKTIKLYKIEDEDVSEVGEAPLKQEMLETDNAFIVFAGAAGLYVWIGKGASSEEKVKVFKVAEKLISDNNLPRGTKVERIVEGTESAVFKQYFAWWKEESIYNEGGFGRLESSEWKMEDLHFAARKRIASHAGAAIGFMPDNGDGTKKIWRIEDMAPVEVPEEQANFLYNGDCYVIQYTYGNNENIVYFWQGKNCTVDERGASAMEASRIDNMELGGAATQIRVAQGMEPRHFIKMFGGNLVVIEGGKGSGFRNSSQSDEEDDSSVKLFQVQTATGQDDSRAIQVDPVEDGVISDDVYILSSAGNVIIWSGEEREEQQEETDQAIRIAGNLFPGVEPTVTKIGDDGEEQFWSALGLSSSDVKMVDDFNKPLLEPRLFHITEKRAFEIFNFKPSDLVSDDVMILDAGDEVYVWNGSESDEDEKVRGVDMAKKYLDADPTTRDADNCVVIIVKQGQEPQSFKKVFADWE